MENLKLTEKNLQRLRPNQKGRYRIWDSEIPGFYVQVNPSGSGTFFYRYRWHGVARDYKLGKYGALTTSQARKLAQMAAGDVARGIDVQRKRQADRRADRQRRRATLGAFIEDAYSPYLLTERKSGDKVLSQLKCYFGHWYHLPLSDITEWRVKRWRQDQIKKGRSNGAINRPVTYLRSCLNKAYRLGVIDKHPLQNLDRLKEDKGSIVRYLSRDEECRLRLALEQRDEALREARLRYNIWLTERHREPVSVVPKDGYFDHITPIVLLALNTGLRRGELFNLKWSHFDATANTVTVVGKTAKSSNTRHVPLCQEALSVLKKWHHQNPSTDLIFPNPRTGERLTDISNGWASVLKAASITKLRFHDLRHHFASSLVMGGVDLNTVRELLGHSTLQMTLRYAHLSASHRTRAVAVLDNRGFYDGSETTIRTSGLAPISHGYNSGSQT